jgi:hypothetical protein
LSIVYIKSSEDLYFCYKYKPIIITNTVESSYINNLNRASPSLNDDGELLSSCYLIRKYKGKITQHKSNNIILVVDDKLARSQLGFSDFSHLISNKLELFDLVSYNYFVDLCKKWANPYKWLDELQYLEGLEEIVTVKLLNILYVNSRVDVWDYINNVGKGGVNYNTILSLDSNTLWYLFIIKGVLSSCKNIDAQVLSYFELLKMNVLEGSITLKFALVKLELYAQTREQI